MLRRRRSLRPPSGRSTGVRQWIIPTLGAITPVALIVVNIAAFIVHHLGEFRLVITVMAFISGLMLNSWMGVSIFRWFKSRHQEHALVHESNFDIVLIGGMAIIIAISAATALFCYLGLSNEKDLPNAWTFLTGIGAILFPVVVQRFFQKATRTRESRVARSTGLPSAVANPPPYVPTSTEQPR